MPLVSYIGNRSIANANQQLLTRSKSAYDCEDDIADEINSGRRPEATIQSLLMAKECWRFYLVGCIDFCTDYRIFCSSVRTFGVRPVRRSTSREVESWGGGSSGAGTFSLKFDAGNGEHERGFTTVSYGIYVYCKSVEFCPLKVFTFALTGGNKTQTPTNSA